MIGHVYSIESFGAVDSPGIRAVIFLSGCPMGCLYCHNPDTWDPRSGSPMTAGEVLDRYERARPFYRRGGIMVGGGEPLMQIGFVTGLFEEAKGSGIHTCLDTSDITFNSGSQAVMAHFDRLLASTNLTLLDIKHIDPKEHMKLYAQPQDNILTFAAYLEKKWIPMWIRHVMVPSITDREEYLYRLGRYLSTLKNVKTLDVLPYHDMGKAKHSQLGIPYPLEDTVPLPPTKAAESRRTILQGTRGERVHCS